LFQITKELSKNHASLLVFICALFLSAVAKGESPAVVSELRVTTLSTMLTEFRGVGEWGFAALIEADGHTVLLDTGARPDTVLKNAEELGIDLSAVDTVILTHNHWDHAGGLVTLRRALKAKNATALQYTHVGEGIFLPRSVDTEALSALPPLPQELLVDILDVRDDYEALGGRFIVHDKPNELHPGVWITGPIPRVYPERNWTPFMRIKTNDSLVEDTIPEDQALVINTRDGLIVIAGCGHAGIVNTMEFAHSIVDATPIHAVLGGFHLMSLTDEKIEWTGGKMREFGVEHVVGAHCTGINAVTGLRKAANLSRETAVVGTVGSTFTLGKGIQRGLLNR
jgi:7,8-dihydropterin-6-yl-methyl-4-(beta-D-ribofuranosyl)aminobenzene 5'-phosphate synthase